MHVALVQCPPWGALPPLGTAALKAYLDAHGHTATCIDLNIEYCNERRQDLIEETLGSVYARPDPWASESFDEWSFEFAGGEVQFRSALADHPLPVERWADRVLETDPHVVGFSVQFTNLGVTLQVAQAVRRAAPEVTIVFGGPNVAQDQSGQLALETGVPDLIVEGEGEETLLEVLAALEESRSMDQVRGLGMIVDGKACWTEARPLIADVDSIPFPDFSDIDWTQYPNPFEIPIMTSRGCVLNCAFCYETVYWKRYRTQSPGRIADEIEYQVAHHPLRDRISPGVARFDFSFADSLVNGHIGGLRRTAQLLVDRDLGICWNGQATVNTKMDDDFFALLAKSGCTGLSFGLESGSQAVLVSMGKRFEVEGAASFFERVHRSGIKVIVNVMVGFPTETRADFIRTLWFITRIRKLIFMVNNVSPTGVPTGSRLHQDPEAFSIVPVDLPGWNAGTNTSWTSGPAGTDLDRNRRLRILHRWMQLIRIPHQRLPERNRRRVRRRQEASPEDRTWLTVPVVSQPDVLPIEEWRRSAALARPAAQAAIDEFAESGGGDALVLEAVDRIVTEVLHEPDWAAALEPQAWVGRTNEARNLFVTRYLGESFTTTPTVRPDGAIDIALRASGSEDGPGLRVLLFPPEDESLVHLIALVPMGRPVLASLTPDETSN